jgi:3-oxoacyl-[acyl-carrier protein] reductase
MKKRAIVCGASMGIGKAIALAFAKENYDLLLIARSQEKLLEIKSEISTNYTINCDIAAIDLSETEALDKFIKEYLAKNITVHILVNNSGGPKSSLLQDVNHVEFNRYFKAHVIASQVLTHCCLASMKESKFGRIINIISTSVKQPIAYLGASNTIRGAMNAWSKSMSRELGPYVTINNILPGFTLTERLQSLAEATSQRLKVSVEQVFDDWKKDIPAQRFAEASEIADLAVFLASEKASYINGTNIPIDGGRLLAL